MAKDKTSSWVAELLDDWLKEITSIDILDQFIYQIEKRKLVLHRETDEAKFERLLETYKEYKQGEIIYMITPLVTRPVLKGRPWKWYTAKVNHFYPRKKTMWIEVAWKTKTETNGRYFIYLDSKKLKKYQPSRTEPGIRARQIKKETWK